MSEETKTPAPEGAADDRRQAFARDKDALAMGEEGRRFKPKRRRKVSYLTLNKIDFVDYKDINVLRRFLNDRGKILPSRQTGNTAKQQRMISNAIRKAREMALIPFVVSEMGPDRPGPRRDRYQSRDYTPREPRENREAREAAAEPESQTETPVTAAETPAEE